MSEQLSAREIADLRALAQAGDRVLQYKFGLLLKRFPQLGEPQEFLHWLSAVATHGNGDACWDLAEVYGEGLLLPQDLQQVHRWLMQGAALNHPVCLHQLGVQYLQGAGVAADPCQAFVCFRRAADLGNHEAQADLAQCYFDATGTMRDLAAARLWANCAAAFGVQRAAALMAQLNPEQAPGARSGGKAVAPKTAAVPMARAPAAPGSAAKTPVKATAPQARADFSAAIAAAAVAPPLTTVPAPPSPAALDEANQLLQRALRLRDQQDFPAAAALLGTAAAAGLAEAQFELGNYHAKTGAYEVRGQTRVPDFVAARAEFARAALQGHAGARAMTQQIDALIAKSQAQIAALRQQADRGVANAQHELAVRLLHGDFAPPDYPAAVRYLELAARQNHADAQMALHVIYDQGGGVSKDPAKSLLMLAKAAAQGHGEAMFRYARRYAEGGIDPQHVPWAADIFQRCRQLYPDFHDPGVARPSAAQLSAAAAQGQLDAIYLLAMACYAGDGVEQSPGTGLHWLRLAAARGYPAAQYQLARFHAMGHSVAQDMNAGFALAIKAAQQGHYEARMLLPMFGRSEIELSNALNMERLDL